MLLKYFFKKKKTQEPKTELEKINLNEIENWIDNKTKELGKKEKEIFNLIKEKIQSFILDIDKKTKTLEDIDIESKKVEGRAKIIVRQSLDKYLSFVKNFTKELTDIDKQNINQFIRNIDKIFSDFDKRSYIFYQRTNYLVGDELVTVKQEINNLSKYFTNLFNENKKTTYSFNLISSTKSKLTQLNETTIALDKINSEIKSLDKKIMEYKKQEINFLDKIEKTKITKDYLENIRKSDKIKLIEKQLENDILKLKSLIDFKKLTNTFHSNERKMEKIKNYKEDFQKKFAKNEGDDILNLINEAKLDTSYVSDKIKQIKIKKQEISEGKKFIEENKVKKLLEKIEKIKLELENIIIEKTKHIKRNEKIKENEKTILESTIPIITELGGTLSY